MKNIIKNIMKVIIKYSNSKDIDKEMELLEACNAKEEYTVISREKSIIYVCHDAYFHGAQIVSLNFIKILSRVFHYEVYCILIGSGDLLEEFKMYSHKLLCLELDNPTDEEFKEWLVNSYATKAFCNTVVTGDVLKQLALNGITCISMIHEMENVIKEYSCENKLANINEYAKYIIFASEYVKDSANQVERLNEKKIKIKPQGLVMKNNYIGCEEKIKSAIREKFSIEYDKKIVLNVGYGYYRKGIDLFYEIAKEVCKTQKDIVFMWVGKLEDLWERELLARIQEDQMENNVVFAGTQKDVMQFYVAADLFLLTSREDPFPSVVMEAMEASLPVVAFKDGGGYVENITVDTGILCDMESIEQMSAAVKMILSDEELCVKLSSGAKNYVEDKFNFIEYIYYLLELLEENYKKVSVVVPNYNYAHYLRERINSIMNQTYPVYEVIILDDASVDDSVCIIEEMQKKYPLNIKVHMNNYNTGNVFKQWGKGFEIASGAYVWIAEADDLSELDFLEKIMNAMDNNPDTILAYSQSKMMDENGIVTSPNYLDYVSDINSEKWKNDYCENSVKEIECALCVKNVIPNVSAVVFKKGEYSLALEKAEKYSVAGDWKFYIEILKEKGNVAFVSESLNLHRRHTNSVTSTLQAQKHFDEICDMQEYIKENFVIDEKMVQKISDYRIKVKEILGVV